MLCAHRPEPFSLASLLQAPNLVCCLVGALSSAKALDEGKRDSQRGGQCWNQ